MDNQINQHLSAEMLCDYAEGILDATTRRLADEHLQQCADCRRELSITVAYLQGLRELEPARAPANFLANVRARIEKPTPWQSFWARFANPWKMVPAQLAVLTILGITILASYMYQSGGMGPASVVPRSDALEDASQPQQAPEMENAQPKPTRQLERSKPQKSTASSMSSEIPMPSEKRERQQPLAKMKGEKNLIADDLVEKKSDKTAPSVSVEREAASPASSSGLSASENSAPSLAARAEESQAQDQDQAQAMPEIVLHLRNNKDSATILMGLKAMGVEVISENRRNGLDLIVRMSSNTIPDAALYLERSGKIEWREKAIPKQDPAALVTLRILLLSATVQDQK